MISMTCVVAPRVLLGPEPHVGAGCPTFLRRDLEMQRAQWSSAQAETRRGAFFLSKWDHHKTGHRLRIVSAPFSIFLSNRPAPISWGLILVRVSSHTESRFCPSISGRSSPYVASPIKSKRWFRTHLPKPPNSTMNQTLREGTAWRRVHQLRLERNPDIWRACAGGLDDSAAS